MVSSWPWGDSVRSGGIAPALCTSTSRRSTSSSAGEAAYVVEVGDVAAVDHDLGARDVVLELRRDPVTLLLVAYDELHARAEARRAPRRWPGRARTSRR